MEMNESLRYAIKQAIEYDPMKDNVYDERLNGEYKFPTCRDVKNDVDVRHTVRFKGDSVNGEYLVYKCIDCGVRMLVPKK